MSTRARIVIAIAVAAAGSALPSLASAHAYLVRTVPAASGVLDTAPRDVALTYDEAVEPRFAIISVTNAEGRQETTAPKCFSPIRNSVWQDPSQPVKSANSLAVAFCLTSSDG